MITLVLIDDHAILREGLASKFRDCGNFEVIGEAGSAAESGPLLAKKPNVVILDIKLPDTSGITLMQRIKRDYPATRVVILTMYDHVRYALHALENGADGFVVKGAPFEELVQAVKAVHDGQTFVSSTIAPKLIDRVRQGHTSTSLDCLSPREFEALTVLSSGMSLKEAATRMELNEKTVSTYRARFMRKLNLNNNTDLVRYALERGILQ